MIQNTQSLPRIFRFTSTELFTWRKPLENGEYFVMGLYFPGSTYTCTDKEVHQDLRKECEKWLADGKIVILDRSD